MAVDRLFSRAGQTQGIDDRVVVQSIAQNHGFRRDKLGQETQNGGVGGRKEHTGIPAVKTGEFFFELDMRFAGTADKTDRARSAEIGRQPDENHIFPVDENLGRQMHALGRSMGNDQAVRINICHPLGFHPVCQHLSEFGQALGGAVLKQPVAVFGDQLVKDPSNGFKGKFCRIGPAAGQGTHLGFGNQGADVANGRRLGAQSLAAVKMSQRVGAHFWFPPLLLVQVPGTNHVNTGFYQCIGGAVQRIVLIQVAALEGIH